MSTEDKTVAFHRQEATKKDSEEKETRRDGAHSWMLGLATNTVLVRSRLPRTNFQKLPLGSLSHQIVPLRNPDFEREVLDWP